MKAESHNYWDIAFKALTAIGLVATATLAVMQYKYNSTKDQATSLSEAQKPFYAKQLELYEEATAAAATIATSGDKAAKDKATADFWRLYWGPLSTVEDRAVEAAMVKFGHCLDGTDCDGKSLTQLSLDLAHDCRDSIGTSWKLAQDELRDKREKREKK